jgi:hypothetical protein
MKSKIAIELTEQDFLEIFALFTSPVNEEREQVYDEASRFYYRKQNLAEEYSVTQEKKEFAVDAWRAITYFLHRHGYGLKKDGLEYDLGLSSGYSNDRAK